MGESKTRFADAKLSFSGIPVFNKIPLIGQLFLYQSDTSKEESERSWERTEALYKVDGAPTLPLVAMKTPARELKLTTAAFLHNCRSRREIQMLPELSEH
jgi:hypothetical protein